MRLPNLLAPVLFTLLVFAHPARAADADLGTPLPIERLDEMRGGYSLPGGLSIAFGLERAVAINGELVVFQHVDIPDLSRMTPDQAQQLASLAHGQTIQVGGATTLNPGMGTLIIQNALDGQSIQATTTLNTSVNTLNLLQNLNFNQSLSDALRIGGSP
ncbi:hypothetical protein [Cognatilysobacter lacus]|uniref:Uncharacterized protein n=1 Tax=Cognatilysobacter lacus TaxID=1643323 RepID=A0A5D8Z6Y7_9GAMM|nr:hypothetical protein [Lysobacter lacus]TZF89882.1 hypothetical protein FW784_07565 [Lysobacter lacus]